VARDARRGTRHRGDQCQRRYTLNVPTPRTGTASWSKTASRAGRRPGLSRSPRCRALRCPSTSSPRGTPGARLISDGRRRSPSGSARRRGHTRQSSRTRHGNVVVQAEQLTRVVASGIADRIGTYTVFNVPPARERARLQSQHGSPKTVTSVPAPAERVDLNPREQRQPRSQASS
jgi:hypothetical protein